MKATWLGAALVTASALFSPVWAADAGAFKEGQHYKPVPQGQDRDPSQVEVVEFFMYSCPHCYRLEPDAEHWEKAKPESVAFRRVPVIFNPRFESHAKAYYAAEIMGIAEKMHLVMFHAFHEQRNYLDTDAKVKALFVEQGIDAAEFDKVYNSFAVATKVRQSKAETMKMRINSVPTIVVDGVYWTQVGMGGERNPFNVVDALIEQRN